nr:hypothetical protein [uncultured Butyrivibrio sp.]
MPRTQSQLCIHICLDEKSYTILKQKAAFKDLSMNAYLKDLSLNVVMSTYEIAVHNLTEMNIRLDTLTFKASGYYHLVISRDRDHPEVGLDDGESMIKLFKELSAYLDKCYRKLVDIRESDIARERELISQAISKAPRSSYRKTDIEVSVPKPSDVLLTVTQEEKDRIILNIDSSQNSSRDVSGYFRNLILSSRYIKLTRKTDDLNLMAERLYSALRYAKPFITMMYFQGYECADQGRELEKLYKKVQQYEKEIWKIVENDRRSLFEEYDLKIHERTRSKAERRKTRKEKSLCQ